MCFLQWKSNFVWIRREICADQAQFTSENNPICFTILIDWWITCGVFISCLLSHSDGTHSLQRINWWASDVMLNFSKYVLMKKQNIHISDGGAWRYDQSLYHSIFLNGLWYFFGFTVYDGIYFFMHDRVLTTSSTDWERKNCSRLTYNAIF